MAKKGTPMRETESIQTGAQNNVISKNKYDTTK